MDSERLAKLPAWAQKEFKNLQGQRDEAIKTLQRAVDEQTPSPFYYLSHECTREIPGYVIRKHFIQADAIEAHHAGIMLRVLIREDSSIELSWDLSERACGDIALVPESFQRVRLVTKDKMRT